MRGGLRVALICSIISLRLLALILCSKCSNTFNKVLMPTWHHTVKLLFANSVHHFSLLKMCHGWSKHFTSRYDPSTPTHPTQPNPTSPHPTSTLHTCHCNRQHSVIMQSFDLLSRFLSYLGPRRADGEVFVCFGKLRLCSFR